MKPSNYYKNGSPGYSCVTDNTNYTYFKFIKMFLYKFNKYGDIIQLCKSINKYFIFDAESTVTCYVDGKIIDMSSFEDGLKLIKMDEI